MIPAVVENEAEVCSHGVHDAFFYGWSGRFCFGDVIFSSGILVK